MTKIGDLQRHAKKSVTVPRIKLGSQGFEVSAQGLGCMGMTSYFGPPKPEQDMIELIRYAINNGITHLDTADAYGPHVNEVLVGKAIRGIRDKVELATKCGLKIGMEGFEIQADPAYIRACCEGSLKRLDVDYIDLYYLHRVDRTVPIEISMGEMKKLFEEGKVKYIGLSEACPSDIRRAHAVHPITAVQLEWSLWARDIEDDIIPTCRELGIGIVPYSPLGKGFLSGKIKLGELDPATDVRARKDIFPRFQPENFQRNQLWLTSFSEVAKRKNCSTGQLALAWVQQQGKDVCPIPGTSRLVNFQENMKALQVDLSDEDLLEIAAVVPAEHEVAGARRSNQRLHDIWRFNQSPPLSSWQGFAEQSAAPHVNGNSNMNKLEIRCN